ncbi:hypothetical protein [Streptomyces sp. NPDC001404]|uniref:hypothetical protein n=1 Tax=Streptomyces sp. NPDC001404 TaxID=3364571 RepID=UPI0036CA0A92
MTDRHNGRLTYACACPRGTAISAPASVFTAARHLIEPLPRSRNEQERVTAGMVLARSRPQWPEGGVR